MKMSFLYLILVLLIPAKAFADDNISYQVLSDEFKGGIIVFKVEVYENILSERLPSEKELLWVAEQLIGHRASDSRRKLVQFFLPDLKSGAYAIAEMEQGPIEVERQPWSLIDNPQYQKYINDKYEFIE